MRSRSATARRPEVAMYSESAPPTGLAAYLACLCEDSPVGYVGLWHTHLACAGPSFTDRLTLRREAAVLTDSVALLVFARCATGWKPYAYASVKGGRRYVTVAEVDYPSGSSGNGSPVGGENDRST